MPTPGRGRGQALEFQGKKRKTRRELFLERMDGLIPWQRLEERIRPVYPKAGKGRRPYSLALLGHIISASSNEGDLVLDPSCGCATACVAADKLGRRWAGIDISSKAVELVNQRLQQEMGSAFHHGYVSTRTDVPRRTDLAADAEERRRS